MNELKHPQQRATTQIGTTGTSAMHTASLGDDDALLWNSVAIRTNEMYPDRSENWTRSISLGAVTYPQTKKYHVPLPFHFTMSPGKFFPMAAVHGINDVRVTMRLRSLEEIVQLKPRFKLTATALSDPVISMPKFASGVFKHFRLRTQYYTLSGPEASALAAKEQVRLYNDWQLAAPIHTPRTHTHRLLNVT
jgi:hypothetical protein